MKIIFRGDSGFCRWKMPRWCERHGVDYIVGLAKNTRLLALADELLQQAAAGHAQSRDKQRLFGWLGDSAARRERAHGAPLWLRTVTEFATCPVGQLGFTRIAAHPMLGFGMSPEQAFGVLRRFLADPRHRFIPDDLSCDDRVLLTERIPGSNHVTDHYLAGLARQHGLALATFDEPLSRAFSDEPSLVELVV